MRDVVFYACLLESEAYLDGGGGELFLALYHVRLYYAGLPDEGIGGLYRLSYIYKTDAERGATRTLLRVFLLISISSFRVLLSSI